MKNLKKLVSSFLCSITLISLLSPFNSHALNKPFHDYYDARTTYSKPLEPKSQQISGPCWAFAAIATLEGYLSKNGLLEGSLSEKHLLNWANHKNTPGWQINISDGGSSHTSCGYLASGDGPVLNDQCKYNCNNDHYESTNFIKPSFSVRGIKFLNELDNNIIAQIKEAVVQYGAVHAATNNHAVSIIGWNNFCWITKDSGLSNNNYSTLPFYTNLSQLYCITSAKKYDESEKIYQHDRFGINASYTGSSENLTVANTFNISAGETLDSVMIESKHKGNDIKIYYAPALQDGTPNNDKNTWQEVYRGKVPYDGYFTCDLNSKIKISQNKKVAIIVSINSTNGSSLIGAQTSNNNLNVTKESKISFWFDNCDFIETDYNLSIKAITKK